MIQFDPQKMTVRKVHGFLLSAIGPRPIALASTIDKDGNDNLAPFSFFNVFSANPPILIFSPARRGTDATTKHTLENALEVKEVVINVVNFDVVEQMVLASANFDQGINEFEKAGFTPLDSVRVRPKRVKESPVQFECKINDIVALGHGKGSGNLIIAEVLAFHIDEKVMAENGKIDPLKMDLVGRSGGLYYTRNTPANLFEIGNPDAHCIGMDKLPEDILKSSILTGNDLAKLAGFPKMPNETAINEYKLLELHQLFIDFSDQPKDLEEALHKLARKLISENKTEEAWQTLLSFNN